MSNQQVGVEFTGQSAGAVTAAKSTAAAIGTVRHEANSLSPSLNRAEQSIGRASRGALAGSGIFRGLGRSVAFASASFLGGYGLLSALRGAADELVTQVKLNAQVRAELRSTGGVAGVTAKMIDGLAAAEMRKTGADKEQIKAAEIMLLRYTNVRNVVGDGNDIFKRATGVALDLSTALGRDASDAAFALGKALNDPVRGVMQLRRVGAAFTTEEQKQIKSLAEHGKVLEAQKLILDSLTKSYGGTAKAVGDVAPWMRLRSSLKELSAEAIRPLLPDIDSLVGRVQRWADALAKNKGEQQRLKHDVEEGAHAIGDLAHDVNQIAGAMGGWGNVIKGLLALKVASTMAGWAGGLTMLNGKLAPAGQRTGALLANMRSLARIGTLAVGIDLLFQSKGQGAKGLIGSLLTGVAVGSRFGPWGALVGGALAIDVFLYNRGGSDSGGGQFRGGQRVVDLGQPKNFSLASKLGAGPDDPISDITYDRKTGRWSGRTARGISERLTLKQVEGLTGMTKKELDNRIHQGAGLGPNGPQGPAGAPPPSVVAQAKYYGTGGGKGVYGVTNVAGVHRALDCSAYVYEVFTGAGFKNFPGVSETQWSVMGSANWTSQVIDVSEAQPGDVVFYNVRHGEGAYPNHVGIVVSGRGRSAMVMQYYTRGKGSGTFSIIQSYPIQGVKRFAKVGKSTGLGGGGGGANSPDTAPTSSSSASSHGKSNVSTVTGSNLIPIGLRGAIGHAANMATTTHGLVAARWLHTEIQDLEKARSLLEEKLKTAHGKQRTAIQAEIQSIDTAIARTQKSFAGALAGWARATLARIEKQADAAFAKQTAAHIQNVLAPRYFQGTDAHGKQRLTPAEAALAAMQAQDVTDQLQAQLKAAQTSGDPAQIAAAQRAIAENDLAAKAAKERAEADADYSKAVARYQKDRSKLEAKMNAGLSRFVDEVARGTKALSGLAGVLEHFGLPGHTAHPAHPGHRGKHTHRGLPPRVIKLTELAGGGKVPGPMYVNRDTVPALLTPGETVIDKRLTSALEQLVLHGGGPVGGGGGDVYMDSYRVGKVVARPVADAQRRQITYTLQRG